VQRVNGAVRNRIAAILTSDHVSRSSRRRLVSGAQRRRGLTAAAFVAPLLILIVVFMLYPIVSAVDLSFRNAKTFTVAAAPFVGLKNYNSIFSEPGFRSLLWHSVLRGVGGAIPSYVLGLCAALALNRRGRGVALFRVVALIPFVLSTPVAVNTWLQLLDPNFGFLGAKFGGKNLLADPDTVWPTLLVINTWFSFQFYTILLLAALQRIPTELYEAAQIDGAGALRRFMHVTMPALAPVSAVFLGIHFMLSFQEVNLVLVATGGGPANVTQTLATYAYATGFGSFNIGFAAAVSVVSVLLMFASLGVFVLLLYLVVRVRRATRSVLLPRWLQQVTPARVWSRLRTRRLIESDIGRRRARRPGVVSSVVRYIPQGVVAIVGVAPLLFLLSQSFDGSPPGAQRMTLLPVQPTLRNYPDVLGNPDLRTSAGPSLSGCCETPRSPGSTVEGGDRRQVS